MALAVSDLPLAVDEREILRVLGVVGLGRDQPDERVEMPLPVDAHIAVAGLHVGVHALAQRPLARAHPPDAERGFADEVYLPHSQSLLHRHVLADLSGHEPADVEVALQQLVDAKDRAEIALPHRDESARHGPQRKSVASHLLLAWFDPRASGIPRGAQEKRVGGLVAVAFRANGQRRAGDPLEIDSQLFRRELLEVGGLIRDNDFRPGLTVNSDFGKRSGRGFIQRASRNTHS